MEKATEARPWRARLRFWRSPADQPRWARPALLAIAALAAALYAWNIRASGYAMYYSVAVKSMSVSWKAFFYGALDPGATVTIDKLAGSFAPQALSARIFGYHQWSVTLPQVVEGVIAVLAMYGAVRRWFGAPAGLIAAGIFAGTPILASMFGHPMEDGLLTMSLVLAADAFSRALAEGRLRSLILAGVWIGVGFQAKMLQAWMALPAMVLAYLFLAPTSWRRRFTHLAVAGAVTLAVSLSWIALYTLTPAADRPYVDGSTSNSAFAMVFGYNGVDRFGVHLPGAAASMFSSGNAGGPQGITTPGGVTLRPAQVRPGGGGGPAGGGDGWLKLVGTRYSTQVGWLYPLTLLSLVAGLVWYRRTRAALAGYVFWGLWLLTYVAVFSKIVLPHTAYLASLAPPIAALSGAGIVMFGRALRDGHPVGRWLLPVAALAEGVWAVRLSSGNPGVFGVLGWAVLGAAIVALGALVGAALSARARRIALVAGLAFASLAIFAAPAAWSASVLNPPYGGSAFDASAGPGADRRGGPGGGRGGGPGGFMTGGDGTLTADQVAINQYLVAHRGTAKYLAAAPSWRTVGSYIMATGEPYLPLGGFSGSIPAPTLAQFQAMVKRGELRYFLLAGGGGVGGFGGFPGGGVQPGETGGTAPAGNAGGTALPGDAGGTAAPGDAGGAAPAGDAGAFGGRNGQRAGGAASSIMAWVQQNCQEVPAQDYGGSSGGLYAC